FIEKFKIDEDKLNIHAKNKKDNMKELNGLIDIYEERLELIEEIDTLKSMYKGLKDSMRSIAVQTILSEKEAQLSKLKVIEDKDVKNYITKADNAFYTWLFFTSIKYLKRIIEPKYEQLLTIIKSNADDEERINEFNSYILEQENFKNLLRICPIILTTNQSAHRLGEQTPSFDLVILDEAGQCAIGPSLFSISRGQRLMLVGDQNQLKPVVTIAPKTNRVLVNKYGVSSAYDYLNNSILLSMQKQDTISKFILLSYHYRSRKDIIEFSNRKYYKGQLKIETPENAQLPDALEYVSVDSSYDKLKTKNVSLKEIEA